MVCVLPIFAVFCIGLGAKIASEATPSCSTEEGVKCYERFKQIATRLRNTSDDEVATKECSALGDVSKCMDDYLNKCLTPGQRAEIKNVLEETQEKCEEEASRCYVNERSCYSNVTLQWPYEYHLNRETLDSRCRENPYVRSCLQSVYEECRESGDVPVDLEERINHTKQVDETFCKDGHPEREEYLKHSKCLGDIYEDFQKTCIDPSLRYLEALFDNEVKMDDGEEGALKRECCNDEFRRLCVTGKIRRHCGEGTLDFLKGTPGFEYSDDRCDTSWTAESEICQSVLPKTFIYSLVSLTGNSAGNSEKPLLLAVLFAAVLSTLFVCCIPCE